MGTRNIGGLHERWTFELTLTKTDTQEPTFAKEVEPQEPVLPHDNTRAEEHTELDIVKDTKTMLKDLAQTILATTSQVKIFPTIAMSATRYATWILDALP